MGLEAVAAVCRYGLLATTLFTFQDYACDNEALRMRCPRGTTISVRWAQYGRLATSNNNDLCPAVTWRPLDDERRAVVAGGRREALAQPVRPSPRTDSFQTSAAEDTATTVAMATMNDSRRITCLASTSLQVVVDLCQGRSHCRVAVNHTVFNEDPCPNIGKYLEVAYQCQPAKLKTRVACQGSVLHVKCSKVRLLAVQWAIYGYNQHSGNVCTPHPGYDTDCQAPCSLPTVARRCHGQQECRVAADETTFGDSPCRPGTVNQLTVVYACVPPEILRVVRDDESLSVDPSCLSPSSSMLSTSAVSQLVPLATVTPSLDQLTVIYKPQSVMLDWVNIWRYVTDNCERFILYLLVSLFIGAILVLLVIILRLSIVIVKHRRRLRQLGVQPSRPARRGSAAAGPPAAPVAPAPADVGGSFVDSGRGSLRAGSPELSRGGGGRPRQPGRRSRSPFEPQPMPPAQPGAVPLPPRDSPVFVHVESPRESPLLGRAPPAGHPGTNSDATPPSESPAEIRRVESPIWVRLEEPGDVGDGQSTEPSPAQAGSSSAGGGDTTGAESPVWVHYAYDYSPTGTLATSSAPPARSSSSVSPASTLAVSTSGRVPPRRAAAVVYPRSSSPPVRTASGGPEAGSGLAGEPSGQQSLTRSYSNPYRQDTYRTVERRARTSHRPRRHRLMLRFE